MASRGDRRAENQELFRRGNEGLHKILRQTLTEDESVRFLCECADENCVSSVEVKMSQWEALSRQPTHYLIVAGHPRVDGEEVVDTLGDYQIVRKPS